MLHRTPRVAKSVLIAVALGGIVWVSAGDLNPPPGPVSSTMKTLTEVEPRVAVQSLNGSVSAVHVIDQPGSYYLTGNILGESGKSGVSVQSDDVTIDLNGHTLEGIGGATHGIDVSTTRRNIAVRNGVVRGWGGDGVRLTFASNSTIEGIRAYDNAGNGIRLGSGGAIANCTSEGNGGIGIITNSGCTLTDSVARANGGDGFGVGGRNNVTRCNADGNTGNGFSLGTSSSMTDCVSNSNNVGIRLVSNSVARDNACDQNAATGIHAVGNENRIQDNHVTRGAVGMDIDGTANIVSGNTVRGNTDNYAINGTGNQLDLLLCEIPESIDWPAQVTLAGNLTGNAGITISADDVTIDLNGFSMTGNAGIGINVTSPVSNLSVTGGRLRNWSIAAINAANASDSSITDVVVNDTGIGVEVGDHGTIVRCRIAGAETGIVGGIGCVVRDTLVRDTNGDAAFFLGARANLENCESVNSELDAVTVGPDSVLQDCRAFDTVAGDGFIIGDRGIVKGCSARNNSGRGFNLGIAVAATRCTASNNGQAGFAGPAQCTLVDCSATGSGADGFSFGSAANFRGCRSMDNQADGFSAGDGATAIDCFAQGNAAFGFLFSDGALVTQCSALNNEEDGFYFDSGSRANGCVAMENGLNGIYAYGTSTVTGCTTYDNDGAGILVESNAYVAGNMSASNFVAGIQALVNGSRIERNHVSSNSFGINVAGQDNLIVGNSAYLNPFAEYSIDPGNDPGATSTDPSTAGPWDNFDQ